MDSNQERNLYNQILTDHNANPIYKQEIPQPTATQEGINPSCGDEITLQLQVEGDVIVDGGFQGYGCAISQASADIMLDLVIGKTKEEALALSEIFLKMIQGNATQEEIEELDEGIAFQDISHMPSRVKCAVLGWHTMKEVLG